MNDEQLQDWNDTHEAIIRDLELAIQTIERSQRAGATLDALARLGNAEERLHTVLDLIAELQDVARSP